MGEVQKRDESGFVIAIPMRTNSTRVSFDDDNNKKQVDEDNEALLLGVICD